MPVLSKEFLDIQLSIVCGFTLKHVHDMIKTYRHKCIVDFCFVVAWSCFRNWMQRLGNIKKVIFPWKKNLKGHH